MKPRVGLFGIMQELYDDMIPGITETQAAYAAEVADHLQDVAEVVLAPPVRNRADAEQVMRSFEQSDLDGVIISMLTYGPAMDFPSDSILMSHMGEGNWRIARKDEPVKLIKRSLGIGRLNDPPTFLFRYQPGPATLASLVSLGGEKFRMAVAQGENLDSPVLPALEMHYGQFRPDTGVRDCMDGWLASGGTHHMVMNLGNHAAHWRVFCRLNDIEYVQV